MGTELWAAYVQAVVPRGEKQTAVGEKSGTTQGNVSKWVRGKSAPNEGGVVAAFAKAYGHNVLEAFVAAGFITEEEAGRGLPVQSRRLLAELREASATRGGSLDADEVERARAVGRSMAKKHQSPPPSTGKISRTRRRSTN